MRAVFFNSLIFFNSLTKTQYGTTIDNMNRDVKQKTTHSAVFLFIVIFGYITLTM